jgi:thymidylate kinase
MIVIVEGIDRVGKTTLCNKLKSDLGFKILKDEVFKPEHFTEEIIAEKFLTTVNMLKLLNKDIDIVIDRFYLSEAVYGLMERKYDSKYLKKIELELLKLDAIIILVNPTDIEESSKKHGKDLTIHSILFNLRFEKIILRKILCKYDNFKFVVEHLKDLKVSEKL